MADKQGPRADAGGASTDRPADDDGRPGRLRHPWVRRILLGLLGLLALLALVFAIVYWRTDIPEPNADAQKQQSILYYDDGRTELTRFTNTTREDVAIDKIPEHVRFAFLSAEDRSFYENGGISPTGIVRAFWTNLRGGSTQGGSTITQQYVKNYFLTQDRTVTRKLKEVMISLKIDNEQSKDEILRNYLNTIYFGRNAYGIQAASRAYFDKDADRLTVSEGAFLSALVKSPSRYDPATGSAAKERVNARMVYVLDGMVEKGWLDEADRQKQKFPLVQKRRPLRIPGPNGYIREQVEAEMKNVLKLDQEDIDRGGLRITTTINQQAQESAVEAIKDEVPNVRSTQDLHIGLVAQKPGDGAVVAFYGGRDPAREPNNVTYQTMQAASGYKVFGLIAALQRGLTLDAYFNGNSPAFFKEYEDRKTNPTGKVSNFENKSYGTLTLKQATANSVNTAFLNLNKEIGPQNTREAAVTAGIPSARLADPAPFASILGTDSVRVMDMNTAFTTIAGEGVRAKPYYIKQVTSKSSDYRYTAKPQTSRAFPEDIMLNTTDALREVVRTGTASYGTRSFRRPAAGKTGTSNGNYAVWFNGFTPQLAGTVGIFKSTDGGKTTVPMTNIAGIENLTGGTFPTKIWAAFMRGALRGQPIEQFPPAPALKETYTRTNPVPLPAPGTPGGTPGGQGPAPSPVPAPNGNPGPLPPASNPVPSVPVPSVPVPSDPVPTTQPTAPPVPEPTVPPQPEPQPTSEPQPQDPGNPGPIPPPQQPAQPSAPQQPALPSQPAPTGTR